jgi:hypothetical protein
MAPDSLTRNNCLDHSSDPSFHCSLYKMKYFVLIFWKGFINNIYDASVFLWDYKCKINDHYSRVNFDGTILTLWMNT